MMRRPWGIKLPVAILVFEAIIGIIGIIMLFLINEAIPSQLQIYSGFIITDFDARISIVIASIVLLIPIIVTLILAKYLWDGNRFAWGIMLVFTAFSILSNLAVFNLFSVAFNILVILGLLHADTLSFINPNIRYRGWKLEG